jgi:hypothetical protein
LGFFSPDPEIVFYNLATLSRLTGRCKSGINAAFVQANWQNVLPGSAYREALMKILSQTLMISPAECRTWTVRVLNGLSGTTVCRFIAHHAQVSQWQVEQIP